MVFAFTACGGGGSSDSSDAGNTDTKLMGESTDLISCDEGEVKYIGFQKADPKLTEEENAYVFVFDYTNHKDEPSMCQSTFWIQFFQNNSELPDDITYNSAAEEQYELVGAWFNEALKDGTVRFGKIIVPKDDSPITIMAKEQNNQDHYETIEVNLSDGTVSGGSSDASSDSSNSTEQLAIGDTAKTDVVEVTVTNPLFGKKVALGSEDPDNYHLPTDETKGLAAGDGNTYFIFDFDVKNIGKESISGGDICGMDSKNHGSLWTLDYNDGYTFDNGDYADLNLVFGGNYNYNPIMDPLSSSHFRGIIKCAEEVETNESAPLILHIVLPTSNGTQNFDYKIR